MSALVSSSYSSFPHSPKACGSGYSEMLKLPVGVSESVNVWVCISSKVFPVLRSAPALPCDPTKNKV